MKEKDSLTKTYYRLMDVEDSGALFTRHIENKPKVTKAVIYTVNPNDISWYTVRRRVPVGRMD